MKQGKEAKKGKRVKGGSLDPDKWMGENAGEMAGCDENEKKGMKREGERGERDEKKR